MFQLSREFFFHFRTIMVKFMNTDYNSRDPQQANNNDSIPRWPSVQTRVQSASLAALDGNVLASNVCVGRCEHTVTSPRDLLRCESSASACCWKAWHVRYSYCWTYLNSPSFHEGGILIKTIMNKSREKWSNHLLWFIPRNLGDLICAGHVESPKKTLLYIFN